MYSIESSTLATIFTVRSLSGRSVWVARLQNALKNPLYFGAIPMHPSLDKHIYDELRVAADRGLANGTLATSARIQQQVALFRERFGPEALGKLDGDALLQLMHGRQIVESRCLAYWLEYKDDDEFAGKGFGLIGGGSAFMFRIFQRQSDGAWISGTPRQPQIISQNDAIAIARRQRDELLAGDTALTNFDARDTSDEAYGRLQKAMDAAAPELSRIGWAHKYWFLLHSDLLDDYHSPRYQRFHLFKLLQMPPDRTGVRDGDGPRFLCAGRFISAAQELGIPVTTLDTILSQRADAFHRYWRIGTTAEDTKESQWPLMRAGNWVSIGWKDAVANLTLLVGQPTARNQVRDMLLPLYANSPNVATRKAGEILNFVQEIAETDIVLACEGRTVHGVGRIQGPYDYDPAQHFPHKRPVEWLLLNDWTMPQEEGLQTTVMELGRNAENLLEVERRLSAWKQEGTVAGPRAEGGDPLPELDPMTKRVGAFYAARAK
jgi:5-methylcytosine-specific restriction enzyme B